MTDTSCWVPHMRAAYNMALSSPDPSTQNGAILVCVNGCGHGWNDFPAGTSTAHWYGPKDAKYARVVHAEMAAICDAALLGISTVASTLVSPWAACANCAKHMVAAGVRRLVRHPIVGIESHGVWADDVALGDTILRDAGVTITEIPPVRWDRTLRRNGTVRAP